MKHYIYFLAFLLLISCHKRDNKISLDQQLQQLHEKGLFNGAIIVTENDSVLLSKGYGFANYESQMPFETTTPMDTGSITKNFTALAMLMLADSNSIDLNTPVTVFIQDFPYPLITIRHLLEQTSGIISDDYVFEKSEQGVPLTNQTFLDVLIADNPALEFLPGSQFMYNGYNYRLLAIIIEHISKVSYEEYITKNITEPIGMKDWFLRPTRLNDLPNHRAIGYSMEQHKPQIFDSEDFEAFYGDCNLFFSAEDLSKWAKSFSNNPPYPSDKLFTTLQTKSRLSDFNLLHWYSLVDQKQYHFTGDWKGFYTMVYFDVDKKRTIVYLTNTNIPHWLRPALVRNINRYLNNESIADWEPPEPVELIDTEIIGSYQLNENQIAQIEKKNNQLTIAINEKSVGLFKLDSEFYYAPGIDLWIWFTKSDGESPTLHCSSIYTVNHGVPL